MDWRYGSRGSISALQVQSPEFKPQSHRNKTKKTPNKTKAQFPSVALRGDYSHSVCCAENPAAVEEVLYNRWWP
jgi:hypothetical protein